MATRGNKNRGLQRAWSVYRIHCHSSKSPIATDRLAYCCATIPGVMLVASQELATVKRLESAINPLGDYVASFEAFHTAQSDTIKIQKRTSR